MIKRLYRQYQAGDSLDTLAACEGVCRNTIKNWFLRAGLCIRTKQEAQLLLCARDPTRMRRVLQAGMKPEVSAKKGRKGRKHARSLPLGSRRKHKSKEGLYYWRVKVAWQGVWPYEHRIVMEKTLGRKLRRDEVVHHENEDTLDNHPENLEVKRPIKHLADHATKWRACTANAELMAAKLRLKPGQWSRRYSACIECGTKQTAHASKGRCFNCYGRQLRREGRIK